MGNKGQVLASKNTGAEIMVRAESCNANGIALCFMDSVNLSKEDHRWHFINLKSDDVAN
jgi:hypothetical protein